MKDASTFHRSSTALVVQDLQNDVVTEGGVWLRWSEQAAAILGRLCHDRRRPRDLELGAGRVPRAGPWCRVARRAARDPHLAGERSVARAWAGSPALQLMGSEPAGRSDGLDQRRAAIALLGAEALAIE